MNTKRRLLKVNLEDFWTTFTVTRKPETIPLFVDLAFFNPYLLFN